VFINKGCGARVTDRDGNEYIDYVGSYGPLILGHSHPHVLSAINQAATMGTSFGMPTEVETRLAEMVVEAVPAIEVVRFVNSGTEAAMSAIRLARAATGRPKLVKCTGCYHGHSDALLVQAGSGATTLGVPSSPGVPAGVTADTLLVPFNDLDAAARTFNKFSDTIACMAVEPIAGNMGCIRPKAGYLEGLRALCDEYGALLLFDEVMTGFRVAYGGAQQLYGVLPDLTCLGKVVGGGLPCAAYGGRESVMRQVAPDGPMYQAGTLSGNPLAMAAGIATLQTLRDGAVYAQLERSGATLVERLRRAAARSSVPVTCTHAGSMVSCFFLGNDHQGDIENYEQALTCNTDAFALFFHAMLERGVMLPPSQFETWFVSTAHDKASLDDTAAAADDAFATVAEATETTSTR
jgi:glutamate-1-semialdehyde 2,1-aminomutase